MDEDSSDSDGEKGKQLRFMPLDADEVDFAAPQNSQSHNESRQEQLAVQIPMGILETSMVSVPEECQ